MTAEAYLPTRWEDPACPFCASRERRPHERFGPGLRYTYLQCRGCDLVYLAPRPVYDAAFTDAAYGHYLKDPDHIRNNGQRNAREELFYQQNRHVLAQMRALLGREGSVLEIGSSSGLFMLPARDAGWRPFGLELSPVSVEACRRVYGLQAVQAQYHEHDFAGRRFDAVYASHVFEHIPDPNGWMQLFRRDLVDDGLLVIQVPNQYALNRTLKRVLRRGVRHQKWDPAQTPDHLFEPHLKPMRWLLERHGFELLHASSYTHKAVRPEGALQRWFHERQVWGSNLRLIARRRGA